MHGIPAACEHYLTQRRPYRDEINGMLYAILAKKIVRTGRNKRKATRVESRISTRMGEIMPRPLVRDQAAVTAVAPGVARTRYLVVRQEDVWFIKFDGEEFGPYQSDREAMLFAIDAAQKLGEQGEETQVLRLEEDGGIRPAWTYGIDAYPPRL
jgi:hypothetical protein